MTGKRAVRAALCAGMLVAGAGSARALELKDLVIQFEGVGQVTSSYMRHEPYRLPVGIDAIAGKLVWVGSTNCRDRYQSLVYQPGTLTGSADCPRERRGTSKDWIERGGTATYNTSMTVAGNVVTLQGKMTGRETIEFNNCGSRSTQENLIDVTQSLKIRIVGMTCQVLQFGMVNTTAERQTYSALGGELKTSVSTTTWRLAPNAKCTVRRRSEQPIRPPGGFVSAKGNC